MSSNLSQRISLAFTLLSGSGRVRLLCSTTFHLLTIRFVVETIASLQAFRKRHLEAQRVSNAVSAQPTTVDFAHYRSVLKNKAIVDEAEKLLKEFKPTTYDVSAHIKAIETFEVKAVSRPSSSPCMFVNGLLDRQGKGDRGEN